MFHYVCLSACLQFSSTSQEDPVGADDDDEGHIQSALNNPLVLHQIFTNLTTAELISSCSLVNKYWNFQARSFIRNHRNDCQAYVSSKSNPSSCAPCIRLREFVDTLTHMAIAPFSSISLVHRCHNLDDNAMECKEYSHAAPTLETIVSKMRLKNLKIKLSGYRRFSCATIQYFAFLLLRQNAHELESLQVSAVIPSILTQLVKSWAGEFSKLERIAFDMSGPELRFGEDFCRTIIQGAPNLKALIPHTYCIFEALEILPEDQYYRMLGRFDLLIRHEYSQNICVKAGGVGPALEELHVHNAHALFKPELITVFRQLLHSSRLSLKALRMRLALDDNNAADYFTSVEWPTLVNLKYFYLGTGGAPQEWARTIRWLIDYTRIFPALECVTLSHGYRADDDDGQQPQENLGVPYVCQSVTKLDLSLDFPQVTLMPLETVFPSVRFLRLSDLSPSNSPPLDQVFCLWPKLEELFLEGREAASEGFWQNADADFCGITREEVETLWGENEEFLRTVHIVPIRPCLSTLKSMLASRICTRGSKRSNYTILYIDFI